MKPLTRYHADMASEDDEGCLYIADEADAVIRELEAEVAKWKEERHFQACITRELLPYQERAIKAEAERDAARADAERYRVNAERYEWLRLQNNRERGAEILTRRMNADAAIDSARGVDSGR